jgi:hypothetical protein
MTKEEILKQIVAGELEVEEASKLLAELEELRRGSLYCKVSESGAISVTATLHVEQWERLLGFADEIREFLEEHDSELKRKEQ